MTVIKHELKLGFKTLIIWTSSIAFFLMICVFMFPEMKNQMEAVSEMFASMGSFTAAFGMDKLNFGTLIGFYTVECGNILGLGGAFFSSFIAISILSKEEKDGTAEFLLTNPIKRSTIMTSKLLTVMIEIIVMNIIIWLLSIISILLIKETIPMKEITLLHLAYLIMQIEIAGICFSISAFMRKGNIGLGLGFATLMYFLNIISNLSDKAKFLKYITPFGYTEGSEIINCGHLDGGMMLLGLAYMTIFIVISYIIYERKDIK